MPNGDNVTLDLSSIEQEGGMSLSGMTVENSPHIAFLYPTGKKTQILFNETDNSIEFKINDKHKLVLHKDGIMLDSDINLTFKNVRKLLRLVDYHDGSKNKNTDKIVDRLDSINT